MNLSELRLKYPQYNDLSDEQLVNSFHKKYYSDIPLEKFHQQIGYKQAEEETPDLETKGFRGVLSDALSGAGNFAMGIPSALMNLPAEGYGAAKQVATNPLRAAQNVAGGFGDLGHGILSAPGNIRDYLQKKDIVSESAPSFRLPESILPKEYNYQEALGRNGEEKGDTLLSGIPSGIAIAPFADALLAGVETLPLSKTISARPLNQAKQLIKDRGIKSLVIDKNIIKDAKQILPNNVPYKELLKKARKGGYEDLFTLQSDLGDISRELTKSSSGAERLQGIEAGKLRTRLLDNMKTYLKNADQEDIAELMTKGQNKYRQHMKIRKTAKTVGVPLTGGAIGYEGWKLGKKIFD